MSRPFLDLLREHRNGLTHDELSDALSDLVQAVTTERKAGKLTFTLSVKPHGDGAVMVADDLKLTIPRPTKGGSLFFATPEGALVREDPKQHKLPLVAIETAPREPLREAPAPAARVVVA